MSAKDPKCVKTMDAVWRRLMEYAKDDKDAEKNIAEGFNRMLDTLLGEDFFGTEGQCDPRGDHRD